MKLPKLALNASFNNLRAGSNNNVLRGCDNP